ncbi:MAG: hypothetical protein KKB30_12645 [Proteobacteria bacterium]|nr:hypothetical protein [Pseudomonadota bacterium]MBU1714638.1 hypothetical protein [Pseudomonadota bacterium]
MSDFDSSQKLIKCNVCHLGKSPTIRFVEIELFKAWAYIMFHRHGLSVSDMSQHLWVDMVEYESRKSIYDKLEQPEAVDHIELLITCGTSNTCHTVNRFTFHQDVDEIKSVLLSHLCEDIRSSKNYQFIVTTGYAFKMKNESEGFLLGLEGSNCSSLF